MPSPSLVKVSDPHIDQGQAATYPSPRLLHGMWQHPVGETDKRTQTGKDVPTSTTEAGGRPPLLPEIGLDSESLGEIQRDK